MQIRRQPKFKTSALLCLNSKQIKRSNCDVGSCVETLYFILSLGVVIFENFLHATHKPQFILNMSNKNSQPRVICIANANRQAKSERASDSFFWLIRSFLTAREVSALKSGVCIAAVNTQRACTYTKAIHLYYMELRHSQPAMACSFYCLAATRRVYAKTAWFTPGTAR